MNIVLWIVQILLALAFLGAGISKAFMPIDSLGAQMPWVLDVNPLLMVRLPGIAEILGAIGLIVPSIVRIQPKLTVWAAYALALVMALAIIFVSSTWRSVEKPSILKRTVPPPATMKVDGTSLTPKVLLRV